MKRIAALITLCVFVWGCGKDPKPTPNYDPNTGDLVYTIDSVHDLTVEQSGTASMKIFVDRSKGTPEVLSLSTGTLPKGVTVSFSPASGTPSFNAVVNVQTDHADAGDFPISIKGYSQTTNLHDFDFTLHVTPYTDPSLGLEGTFTETRSCSQTGPGANPVTVKQVAGKAHTISITGIWADGTAYTAIATIDPTTKAITMPAQVLNGVTFTGTGSYTDYDHFTITYSVVGTVTNDNCTATYVRQ